MMTTAGAGHREASWWSSRGHWGHPLERGGGGTRGSCGTD